MYLRMFKISLKVKKEDIAQDRRDDWDGLQNYISAMNFAILMNHK